MVTVRPRSTTTLRCALCHDDARDATQCSGCQVLVHAECTDLSSGCPTLGCPALLAVVDEAAPPLVVQLLSTVGAILILAALVVGAVTKLKDALAVGHGQRDAELIRTKITGPIQ